MIEIELTDLAHGGDAVGRHEGRAVFIPGGIPGEVVRAEITEERRAYARAQIVEILKESPDRAVPRYPDLSETGGFQWQHLAYPAQLDRGTFRTYGKYRHHISELIRRG